MSTIGRLLIGFIVTLGAAGGVETSVTETEFILSALCSLAGLAMIYSGVSKLKYEV